MNIKWIKKNNKINIFDTFTKILETKHNNFINKININIDKINVERNNNYIIINDNNKNITCKYLMIGMFNNNSNIWYWAWNIPYINLKLTSLQSNIKELEQELLNNYSKLIPKEAEEYYYYLHNNNFYIEQTDIKKLLALIVSITNYESYIIIKKNNLTEYVLITEIIKIK